MGRLGNNPSSRGYATPTYATTTLTARETFGGTSKAGLGRHIGMGSFTYSAIINGSSGHQASFLAGNSFPAAFSAGRLLNKQYPISKTNQLARVGTGTTGDMTRTPADGVNTQQREKMQERVDKWNDGLVNTIANEQLYGNYQDSLPNIITAENFDQYFMYDSGIRNCTNGTGCPTNPKDYITAPGVIQWKEGKSATFRTINPVLPSGYGFLGFEFDSVPNGGSGLWNSIWLTGRNQGRGSCGPCLEIDIYEMNTGWWTAPKSSFHDWPDGHGHGTAKKDGSEGCFGVYLSGEIGDGGGKCNKGTYGEIIKKWDYWNYAQYRIYNKATWYTLITKNKDGKPLAYIGISLSKWLPQSKEEATFQNVKSHSDFLISSGADNIQGDPAGGYYFIISSTANTPPSDDSKYIIPNIVNYDIPPKPNN